jgi:NADH-quinone oxidoreductase subunit L
MLSVIGGVMGLPAVFHLPHLLNQYLSGVTGASATLLHHGAHISHGTEIVLMTVAGLGAIVIILLARQIYVKNQSLPLEDGQMKGWPKLIYHKFYVDELYHRLWVKPTFKLSDWWGRIVDRRIIGRGVIGIAYMLGTAGRSIRLLQSGNTGFYVFAMVSGIILLFIIRLLI